MSENNFEETISTPLSSHVPINLGSIIQNRYRIDKILAEGGMGRVYKAWDLKESRAVAIKQLLLQMDSDNTELIERFRREYYFLSSIDHPNLVKAYELFSWEGHSFLALEYVEGISLKELIQTMPHSLSLIEQIAVANQMARAVDVLNIAGILHRDIKPGNIVLHPATGRIVLLDLGLGKSVGQEALQLTQKGAVIGTLEYLSPEQASGKISPQSDVFSLGITLYQFFLWEPYSPFRKQGGVATIMEITTKDLPPLSQVIPLKWAEKKIEISKAEKDAYHAISQIVAQALQKEPELRPSAGEIADELEKIHQNLSSIKKTVERGNWKVSIKSDVKQIEHLRKLGDKYGRDKDRLPNKRVTRRIIGSKKTTKISFQKKFWNVFSHLPLAPAFASILFLITIVFFYMVLQDKQEEIRELSEKVQRLEEDNQKIMNKMTSFKREVETENVQKLYETLSNFVPTSQRSKFFAEIAKFQKEARRYSQALDSYQRAMNFCTNQKEKEQYLQEYNQLQQQMKRD